MACPGLSQFGEQSGYCLSSMRDRAPPACPPTYGSSGVCSLSCGAAVRPDVRVGHCPRAGHSGSTMAIRGARNQNSHSTVSVPTEEISFPRSAAGPRFCPRVGDAAETQAGCELLTGILGLRTVSFCSPEGPARTQRRGAGGGPGSGRVTRRAARSGWRGSSSAIGTRRVSAPTTVVHPIKSS